MGFLCIVLVDTQVWDEDIYVYTALLSGQLRLEAGLYRVKYQDSGECLIR